LRAVALLLAAAWQLSPAWAVTSSSLSVSGDVATPTTYDLAALQALSQATQTDVFLSGSTAQTHTYTGPTLWSVLQNAGGIQATSSTKNDVLNKVVVVTATDGYKVVYSAGELNPSFGGEAALLAWGETPVGGASAQPLSSDGFARTTAPWDAKGGRYVSNVTSIQVLDTLSTKTSLGGGVSTSFTVSGDVVNAGTYDLAALKSLPLTTQTVGGHTYSGVSFWSFLNSTIGLQTSTDPSVHNDLLDMYVVATGTDGYKVAFSMGELASTFGNQPDLIAFQMDGVDLTDSGFARLVVANDAMKGRWVSNLASLEVFHATPVPEPASCALLLAGLTLLAWRRARQSGDLRQDHARGHEDRAGLDALGQAQVAH
jgi:DMSO/TMAO reductase YedYZ molybdopterin-dependent catalytic subunit